MRVTGRRTFPVIFGTVRLTIKDSLARGLQFYGVLLHIIMIVLINVSTDTKPIIDV